MILSLLALAAVQTEEPPADRARFDACLAQVRAAPQQGAEMATAWLREPAARRLPARRCLGIAFAALEQWAAAATVYEQAAADSEAATETVRADFRLQAGNAWLAAGEPARALTALDAALAGREVAPARRGQALFDRARAEVALDRPAPARRDLDEALRLVPDEKLAWYLSAALARRQGDLVRAATDIARARTLGPDDPDTLLLAGTIVGQAGNMNAAYALYRRVVELAPDSEAGRQAAASLATVREIEEDAPAATAPAPAPTPPAAAPSPQLR